MPSDTETRYRLFSSDEVSQALSRMARDLSGKLAGFENHPILLLGIQQGGVQIARKLSTHLGHELGRIPLNGTLDCAFYRDDIALRLPTPRPTELPCGLDNAAVVLVDDVLDTGRTLRAALDALHEYGRPAVIRCAVLVDRASTLLPLRADVVGWTVPITKHPGLVHAGLDGVYLDRAL